MSTELAIFDKFKAELAAFKAADANRSFDVGNPEGYADCKTYYGKLRKVRNRTNDLRLDTTKGLREEVDAINNEGNEIIAEVDAMAGPYKAQMDAEDAKLQAIIDAKAAEAEAKAAKVEADRLADLEAREAKIKAAEDKLKAEAEAAQKALADAEAAKKIEDDKLKAVEEAQKKAAQDAIDAAEKAEKDKAAAVLAVEQKAHQEKNDKIAKDLADKNAAQKVIDDAAEVERVRVEDKAHRTEIERAIIAKMTIVVDECLNLGAEKIAREVLAAISSTEIPHITINY